MADNLGVSPSLEDEIHELEQELSVASSHVAAAENHIDFVRANDGDIDAATESLRGQQFIEANIRAHLAKLNKLAGRG